MPKLTGAAFNAIKGVFLIGDPKRKAGLACNVDSNGGSTTKNVSGLEALFGSIPANWVSKTLDVCAYVSFSCCLQTFARLTRTPTGRRCLRHNSWPRYHCCSLVLQVRCKRSESGHQVCDWKTARHQLDNCSSSKSQDVALRKIVFTLSEQLIWPQVSYCLLPCLSNVMTVMVHQGPSRDRFDHCITIGRCRGWGPHDHS